MACPHLCPPGSNSSLRAKETGSHQVPGPKSNNYRSDRGPGRVLALASALESTLEPPGSIYACWGWSRATGLSRLFYSFTFLGFNTNPTGSSSKPASQRQPPANHPFQVFSPRDLETIPLPSPLLVWEDRLDSSAALGVSCHSLSAGAYGPRNRLGLK